MGPVEASGLFLLRAHQGRAGNGGASLGLEVGLEDLRGQSLARILGEAGRRRTRIPSLLSLGKVNPQGGSSLPCLSLLVNSQPGFPRTFARGVRESGVGVASAGSFQ